MRTVIVSLFFTLMIFTKPVELMKPLKPAAVYPPPIKLGVVRHYESFLCRGRIYGLEEGFYQVLTDDNYRYIIGIIRYDGFCPLLVLKRNSQIPYVQLRNPDHYQRVKVRIDGEIANVTVPILKEDPLNKQFFKPFNAGHIIGAQIFD